MITVRGEESENLSPRVNKGWEGAIVEVPVVTRISLSLQAKLHHWHGHDQHDHP